MLIIIGHVDIFNAESNIIIAGFAPSMFYILLVIIITCTNMYLQCTCTCTLDNDNENNNYLFNTCACNYYAYEYV